MPRHISTATEARQHPDQEPFPTQKAEPSKLPPRVSQLGFWSALIVLVGGILYLIVTVGNIILGFAYPPVELIQTLAGISTLLMAPGLIVLLACIHSYAPPEKKVLSQLGYTFGVVFAVL